MPKKSSLRKRAHSKRSASGLAGVEPEIRKGGSFDLLKEEEGLRGRKKKRLVLHLLGRSADRKPAR